MDSPFYEFEVNEDAFRFYFESVGPKGVIPKLIALQNTKFENYYNLVLADIKADGTLDIYSKSNNGDMEKILATVVQTMLVFLAYNPKSFIYFEGSTPVRTRLYQIALNREFDKVQNLLTIEGFDGEYFEPFETKKSYKAFLISKKKA
jgi:hypothetical protein